MRISFGSKACSVFLGLVVTACGDDGRQQSMDTTTEGASAGPASAGTVTMTSTTAATATSTTANTDTAESSSGGSTTTGGDGVAPPCPYAAQPGNPDFYFEQIGYGFLEPVMAIGDPVQPDRLFILQQFGQIKILEAGQLEAPAENFLDIDVVGGGEQGLLGMAFHPGWPEDGRIYVYYTVAGDGRSRIEEYTVDPDDPNVADPDSARIILELFQGSATHHGGSLAFDDDGYLIIGFGDGADGTSPRDTSVLHSKFIRIGVEPDGDMDDPLACMECPQYGPFDYEIPDDNPFVDDPAYAPEIYAMGFRNPWRWWFDIDTGEIYAGEVGFETWEEVDIIVPGGDYGWSDLEGNNCNDDPNCDTSAAPNQTNDQGLVAPLVHYQHDPECAVIGGPVYRSCEVPAWDGTYFYGDYCTGQIHALRWDGQAVEDLGLVYSENLAPMGSGTNAWGDVYFTGGVFHGEIFRLAPG